MRLPSITWEWRIGVIIGVILFPFLYMGIDLLYKDIILNLDEAPPSTTQTPTVVPTTTLAPSTIVETTTVRPAPLPRKTVTMTPVQPTRPAPPRITITEVPNFPTYEYDYDNNRGR